MRTYRRSNSNKHKMGENRTNFYISLAINFNRFLKYTAALTAKPQDLKSY